MHPVKIINYNKPTGDEKLSYIINRTHISSQKNTDHFLTTNLKVEVLLCTNGKRSMRNRGKRLYIQIPTNSQENTKLKHIWDSNQQPPNQFNNVLPHSYIFIPPTSTTKIVSSYKYIYQNQPHINLSLATIPSICNTHFIW